MPTSVYVRKTREYSGVQENKREHKKTQGNTREDRAKHENTGEYKRVQGNTQEYIGECKIIHRNIWGNT